MRGGLTGSGGGAITKATLLQGLMLKSGGVERARGDEDITWQEPCRDSCATI